MFQLEGSKEHFNRIASFNKSMALTSIILQAAMISPCLRFHSFCNGDSTKFKSPNSGRGCGVLPSAGGTSKRIRRLDNQSEGAWPDDKEKLEPLWDDGYGSQTLKDYFEIGKEMIKPDGGPPRWFCPIECGPPPQDSPVLLFLPGMDGLGLGLIMHHKALGKAFEVRCLHVPVYDRTPFKGLLELVNHTVRIEQASCPSRPIYLVAESLGGCLALAVAAHNPTVDLVVVLVNPATSFSGSRLQSFMPLLETMPNQLQMMIPYFCIFNLGSPLKMAMTSPKSLHSSRQNLKNLIFNLSDLVPQLSVLADIIPKSTLLWKMKMLKTGAAYANSRLHAIKAEVLVLASCNDKMLPSKDEAQRLQSQIDNCQVRYFLNYGHCLLMENVITLLTVIRGSGKFRRSRRHDIIADYLPPSKTEFENIFNRLRLFQLASSPVIFSTLEDGKIVRGLAGVPNEGPVLLVGNHMLYGSDSGMIIKEFLREKNVMIYAAAHPEIFTQNYQIHHSMVSADTLRIFGMFPVSATNILKKFSTKSFVLLYPGGIREALHYKGEEYKLFWPEESEFVRLAAKFGATIVPFGVVGEDDLFELTLDYNDQMKIPYLNEAIRNKERGTIRLRTEIGGELANQHIHFPIAYHKTPGRFYYLFGKPVKTKENEEMLQNKDCEDEVYLHIKSEIERIVSYLIKKREEDPYRNFFNRLYYRAALAPPCHVPTFEL